MGASKNKVRGCSRRNESSLKLVASFSSMFYICNPKFYHFSCGMNFLGYVLQFYNKLFYFRRSIFVPKDAHHKSLQVRNRFHSYQLRMPRKCYVEEKQNYILRLPISIGLPLKYRLVYFIGSDKLTVAQKAQTLHIKELNAN